MILRLIKGYWVLWEAQEPGKKDPALYSSQSCTAQVSQKPKPLELLRSNDEHDQSSTAETAAVCVQTNVTGVLVPLCGAV